jgi:Subtilase family
LRVLVRCLPAFLAALALVLAAGCGDDPARPSDDGGNPPPSGPQPDGVLLDGDVADPALGALRTLPPSPIDPADARDGVYASRLLAIVAAGATVGDVNAALAAHGARIVAMDAGLPLVTLVIDPVADAAAADAAAAALAGEVAFSFAASVPDPDAAVVANPDPLLRSAPSTSPHFALSRMHAAHNVVQLAVQRNNPVVVLVPDWYQERNPHPDIEHAIVGNGLVSDFGLDEYLGNYGFHASGIIAAGPGAFEEAFHPAPATLIEVRSVPMGGMPWLDRVRLVADQIPAGRPVVISNSRGYGDPDFGSYPRFQRALHAAAWRYRSSPHASQLFVATAAGDDGAAGGVGGTARFGNYLGVSADHPDLLDAVTGEDPLLVEEIQALVDAEPTIAVAPGNIVTVGASDDTGAEDPATSREYDVRTVGEGVAGPCVIADPGLTDGRCTGSTAFYSGSGTAAPQVAALAAYLWNLAPSRTPEQIRTVIDNAYIQANTPGVVDAYTAVLSLDPPLDSGLPMPVRLALLDVAGGSSSGVFDEADLQVYVDAFADQAGAVTDATARYDLNGDGNVAGGGTARFDLDGNVISYSMVTSDACGQEVEFDETSMTDTGILRYYARTRLYTGDPDMRDTLLDDCADVQQATVTLGNYRFTGTAVGDVDDLAYHVSDADVAFQQAAGNITVGADTSYSRQDKSVTESYQVAGSANVTWAVAVSGSTGSAQIVTASGSAFASATASFHSQFEGGRRISATGSSGVIVPFVVAGGTAPLSIVGDIGSLSASIDVIEETVGAYLSESATGAFDYDVILDPGDYYLQVNIQAHTSIQVEGTDFSDSRTVSAAFQYTATFDVP